jgi:hypothetical protein
MKGLVDTARDFLSNMDSGDIFGLVYSMTLGMVDKICLPLDLNII